jgi:hypothetical protein
LQRQNSLFSTPSHSPFIPDISLTSPDVLAKALNVGSNSAFFSGKLTAMSPVQLRTLSLPASARTPDHQTRDATPTFKSRHSFPPAYSTSISPTTPNLSTSRPQPHAFSSQVGRYQRKDLPSNQTAATSGHGIARDTRRVGDARNSAYRP